VWSFAGLNSWPFTVPASSCKFWVQAFAVCRWHWYYYYLSSWRGELPECYY